MRWKPLKKLTILSSALLSVSTVFASAPVPETPVIEKLSGEISVGANGFSKYNLNIELPSGIHGLKPDLEVIYTQNNGMSNLGTGFTLSASSSIKRCTANREKEGYFAGIEQNALSPFCLDGIKLVAVSGENGSANSEYRYEIDTNTKIIAIGGSNSTPDTWEKHSPDGMKYIYTRNGGANDKHAQWLLSSQEDVFGNAITYTYVGDTTPQISLIEYSTFDIKFNYQKRTSSNPVYQGGVSVALDEIVQSVSILNGTQSLYEYRFDYEAVGVALQTERLTSIQKCYGDSLSNVCTNPVTYEYENFDSSINPLDGAADRTTIIPRDFYAPVLEDGGVRLQDRPVYSAVDLDLNGTVEFCYFKPNTLGGIYCAESVDGVYELPTKRSSGSIGDIYYSATEENFQFYSSLTFIDVNGDKYPDYCITDDEGFKCGLNSQDGSFNLPSLWSGAFNHESSISFNHINNDDLIDLCGYTYGQYQCHENSGSNFSITNATVILPARFNNRTIGDEELNYPGPFWLDINGDLNADLCYVTSTAEFWCSTASTDPITKKINYAFRVKWGDLDYAPVNYQSQTLDEEIESNRRFSVSFRSTDLNSDGLSDFCYEKNGKFLCQVNDGTQLKAPTEWIDISTQLNAYEDEAVFGVISSTQIQDVNRDGLPDFCIIYDHHRQCGLNTGTSFENITPHLALVPDYDYSENSVSAFKNEVRKWFGMKTKWALEVSAATYGRVIQSEDFNKDGYPDLCYRSIYGVLCSTMEGHGPQGLLKKVTDSFGHESTINYGFLLKDNLYTSASTVPAGFIENPKDTLVVSSIETFSGAYTSDAARTPISNSIEYSYSGYITHPEDRVSGFQKVSKTDSVRNNRTTTDYYLEKNLSGKPKEIREYLTNGPSSVLLKFSSNNYSVVPGKEPGTKYVRLNSTLVNQYGVDGAFVSSANSQYSDFDIYGYPQSTTVTKTQGSETLTTATDVSYWHGTSSWTLQKPLNQLVTHTHSNGNSVTRKIVYTYNSNGTLKTEAIEPESENDLFVEYSYYPNGMISTKAVTGNGEIRTEETIYDALGRVTESKNALGQTTYYSYDPLCGGVATVTDIGGRETTTEYDALCRKWKVSGIDDANTTWEYSWSTETNVIAQSLDPGYYNPIRYEVKETGSHGPWKISYFDAQGREVRTKTNGFEDKNYSRITVVDKVFNSNGQQFAQSLPYFIADGNNYNPTWTTMAYDLIGRLSHEYKTGPDGQPLTVYHTYTSNSTTTSYSDYSKTTVLGIHEKAISTTENGENVTYDYNAIGDLIETNQEGLVTTLEYDDRGRKSRQIDPSMGTWDYRFNAFGELVWQKDAKLQEVTFAYNLAGQKVSSVSLEGTTTWEYYTAGNGIGQIKKVENENANRVYNYNLNGLPSSVVLSVDGQTFETKYDYDNFGRIDFVTQPNGVRVYNEYGSMSTVDRISIPAADFEDYNFQLLKDERQGIADALSEIRDKLSSLSNKIDYYAKRAQTYSGQMDYFSMRIEGLDGSASQQAQVAQLEQSITDNESLAAGYLQAANDIQTEIDRFYQTERYNKMSYHRTENGNYVWRTKWCSKHNKVLGVKVSCKKHKTVEFKTKINWALAGNIGETVQAKHCNQTTTTYWERGELITATTCVKTSVPQMLSKVRTRFNQLRDAALRGVTSANDQITSIQSTKVWMPRYVEREVWTLIGIDIPVPVKVNAIFTEYYEETLTKAEAEAHFTSEYNAAKSVYDSAVASKVLWEDGGLDKNVNTVEDNLDYLQGQELELDNRLTNLDQSFEALGLGEKGEKLDEYLAKQQTLELTGKAMVWAATRRNEMGQLASELFGNGVYTSRHFNRQTGRVERITTGAYTMGVMRDLTYQYNDRGEVEYKLDGDPNAPLSTEYYQYNAQGRLTDWTYDQLVDNIETIGSNHITRVYDYDNHGNIISKTGAGDMNYDPTTNLLTSRTHNTVTNLYDYDANGNMLTGDDRTYTWTSFNKVKTVSIGGTTVNFKYDASQNRLVKSTADSTIYYVSPGYEVEVRGAETVQRTHIIVGDDVVATFEKYVQPEDTSPELLKSDQIAYYHRDIIGSGELVTGSNLNTLRKAYFSPYGERVADILAAQNPEEEVNLNSGQYLEDNTELTYEQYLDSIETKTDLNASIQAMSEIQLSQSRFVGGLRGYTSHEEVKEVGLINMNARMYDPVIGRFISADTIIPDASSPKAYNRYAYVYGNPVSYRDPDGHEPISLTTAIIVTAIWMGGQLTDNEVFQQLSTVAMAIVWGQYYSGVFAAGGQITWATAGASAAATSLTVTLITTGKIRHEDIEAAGWAAVAAGVANYVGHGAGFKDYQDSWWQKAAIHGATQGSIGYLRGDGWQGFRESALSATLGSVSGSAMGEIGGGSWMAISGRTAVAALVGNITSRATGGDGVDGAVTAAIVHLYNHEGKRIAKALKDLWGITPHGTSKVLKAGNRKYYESKKDGTWWSKDTAGHGESAWKVFKKEKDGLHWVADADEYGQYIQGKHKGDVGKFIPNKLLSSAPMPNQTITAAITALSITLEVLDPMTYIMSSGRHMTKEEVEQLNGI